MKYSNIAMHLNYLHSLFKLFFILNKASFTTGKTSTFFNFHNFLSVFYSLGTFRLSFCPPYSHQRALLYRWLLQCSFASTNIKYRFLASIKLSHWIFILQNDLTRSLFTTTFWNMLIPFFDYILFSSSCIYPNWSYLLCRLL